VQYDHLKNGEESADTEVSVAGRVYSKRIGSKKLAFYDLHGEGAKIQIIMEFGCVIACVRA
jgi:lysyl-tRNA synthetase class 2